jgi:hypothetical protein
MLLGHGVVRVQGAPVAGGAFSAAGGVKEEQDAAASEELGTQGPHSGGPRARPGLGPGVDGRAELLQAGEAVPDVLLGA